MSAGKIIERVVIASWQKTRSGSSPRTSVSMVRTSASLSSVGVGMMDLGMKAVVGIERLV